MDLPAQFKGESPVSWYPGHMLKAEREINKKISQVDIILEVVDARAPLATRNFRFDNISTSKPRILIINKTDYIPEESLYEWIDYFKSQKITVIAVNKYLKNASKLLLNLIISEVEKLKFCTLTRVLIIGVPNVGKSSIINYLINKNKACTGPVPGVTRCQQLIKVNDNISLVDSPGIMTPRIDNLESALKLALVAAIKDRLLDRLLIVEYLAYKLKLNGSCQFADFYKISDMDDFSDLINKIGLKKGKLAKGGLIDTGQTAIGIIKDFRDGKFGLLCLEHPDVAI